MLLLAGLLLASGGVLKVRSQSTNATCTLESFNWTFNSDSKSPCVVASTLLGVCSQNTYDLPSLPDGHHYLGPTIDSATSCDCNTVVYSLISACAACQNRTTISWSEWSANCVTVSISSFDESIPSGLAVPGWAYLDVKVHDTFDISLAEENANATESTAVPSATTSNSKTSSTISTTSTSSASSSTESIQTSTSSSESDDADDRANRIGSAVVGALLGVGAICSCIALLIYYRRRRLRNQASSLTSENPDTSEVPNSSNIAITGSRSV